MASFANPRNARKDVKPGHTLPIAAPRRPTLPQRARLGCTQPTSAGVGMTSHERWLHVAGPGRVCISRLISRSMQLLDCFVSRSANWAGEHQAAVRQSQHARDGLGGAPQLWARWKHRQERRTPLLKPEAWRRRRQPGRRADRPTPARRPRACTRLCGCGACSGAQRAAGRTLAAPDRQVRPVWQGLVRFIHAYANGRFSACPTSHPLRCRSLG